MTAVTTSSRLSRPGSSLRHRLVISHVAVIVLTLLLVVVISAAYLRRAAVTTERDRIADFSRTLTVSVNFLASDRLFERQARRAEAITALARQEGIRLIVLSSTAEVVLDSDPSSNLTGATLDTFADETAALIDRTADSPRVEHIWLTAPPNRFSGQYLLLSAGGPGRGDRAVLIVAPIRRSPVLARLLPRLLVVAAIALAVASVVGSILSGRIAAPVKRLTDAANAMAAGKLDQVVPGDSDDELGQLVRGFNQMSRQIAATSRAQRDLLANVAHELRTPLTAIRGFAQALHDGVVSTEEEHRNAVATIGTEASRMTALISQLLDLARLESGQSPLVVTTVPLGPVTEQVAARFGSTADTKGVTLQTHLDPDGIAVRGDEHRLVQLLSNLVDNAIRHTPSGGRVSIFAAYPAGSAEYARPVVRLTVADTGEGIAPDHLPHLFERFNRGSAADRDGAGFGLGLAIVREIVTLHQGAIAVSSSPGIGTTWQIDLPAAPPDLSNLQPRS